jgi:hypothetical protein
VKNLGPKCRRKIWLDRWIRISTTTRLENTRLAFKFQRSHLSPFISSLTPHSRNKNPKSLSHSHSQTRCDSQTPARSRALKVSNGYSRSILNLLSLPMISFDSQPSFSTSFVLSLKSNPLCFS